MNFQQFKSKHQFQPVKEFPNKVATQLEVTVCVQTYNHELFFAKCIESILEQQTNFSFEIIVSEDDSSDRTRELCITFAERFPNRIKLFLHSRKNNIQVGDEPTGNFPTLYNLFSASGKYIAICEGDDYWGDPLKLQKQYDFMEANPTYSICYHDFKIVDKLGTVVNSNKALSLKKDLSEEDLKQPAVHPAPLTIFFKNRFNTLPEEIVRVINIDIFIYILLGHSGAGKFLDTIKPAFYRIHENGIWSSKELDKKLITKIRTNSEIIKYYKRIQDFQNITYFEQKVFKLSRHLLFKSLKKMQPIKIFKNSIIFFTSSLRNF